MEQSPRLSLSYVMPAQAQKHVTVNETFRRLDALTQLAVLSRTTSAEPVSPAEGDAYILPASPSGTAWDGFGQNNIAVFQDGAWVEIAAMTGLRAWVDGEVALVAFNGSAWAVVTGGGGSSETADKFGINASADTTNKLSVKSSAVLFNSIDVGEGGTGDCQVKVNKEAAGDTASHIFQTGFSGRAEFGLIGSDDFQVKVSANGSSWTDAMTIDKDNGYIGMGTTTPRQLLEVVNGFVGISSTAPGFFLNETNGSKDAFFVLDAGKIIIQRRAQPYGAFEASVFTFDLTSGATFGSPTGGAKGAGTLNAQAVYDDNSLLSCYVFDQALDGSIDLVKWDDRVPDQKTPAYKEKYKNKDGETEEREIAPEVMVKRIHEPLRKFAARAGSQYDPLTLDGYARHWREKRHLTAMPNEVTFDTEKGLATGEWIQRLVETVEIQAVLIEVLNHRLKNVEKSRPAKRV